MKKTLLYPLSFLAVALVAGLYAQGPGKSYDTLIRGGTIVDGTGGARFAGDVVLTNGRIAAIGQLGDASAKQIIDAKGLVVAPGFIDLHTHSDAPLLADGRGMSQIRQGVTLVLLGEGGSVGPNLTKAAKDGMNDNLITFKLPPADWETIPQFFAKLMKAGVSINVATYVGFSSVRESVMDYEKRPANKAELEKMTALTREAMEQGAFGLVTAWGQGGYDDQYAPELFELARAAYAMGGGYYSHVGTEGFKHREEIRKAIAVGEATGIPVHVFHFKVAGLPLQKTLLESIAMIEKARAKGLKVTANHYFYTAMQHPIGNIFPGWLKEGGTEKFVARMKDPDIRRKLKNDEQFLQQVIEHGGWENITVSVIRSEKNQNLVGKSIATIAKERGVADPADMVIDLYIEENGWIHGVHFNNSEENARRIVALPWVAVGSDGRALATDGVLSIGKPHPRAYGTHPQVLRKYVREEKLLTLEQGVRKMTGLSAEILGLKDRGLIKEGFAADITVFDPNTIADKATYENPHQYAVGIPYVFVNGVAVIAQSNYTGARPGVMVPGPAYKPSSKTN